MRRLIGPGIQLLLFAAAAFPHPSPVVSQPLKAPPPGWVVVHDFPRLAESETSARSGASYVLLYDYQYNLGSESSYLHSAIQILNHEGVQQFSDITLDYDPSCQTLALHRLRLHRGGDTIDKLAAQPIQTYQRETNLERYLYDGSLTASIHLADVRIGDIIEYAYSRTGQHPAYRGHSFGRVQLDLPIAVELYTVRLLVPAGEKVVFTPTDTDLEPVVTAEAGHTVYQWKQEKLQASVYDDNVPGWYLAHGMVRYTDYGNWREMVEWALPLFAVPESERARLRGLAGKVLSLGEGPAGILEAIRFVQNEIRYLGLLEGMSAYQPHAPTQVWEQRYGDCKDKALLLCTLLNELGAQAYPMLVGFAGLRAREDFVMAPGDFDHCVVSFRYGGKTYFVDPTASHQGGDLDHLYFPDFRFGLVISPESRDLTPLPEPATGRTAVTEHFVLDGSGGGTLSVVSEYSGSDADMVRFMYATSDLATIRKHYLSYYASMYPEIVASGDPAFSDERRDTDNVIVVTESYQLSHLWVEDAEDSSSSYVEFFPLQMDKMTLWNSGPHRTMPYEVGRVDVRHEFIIDPPEPWPVTPEDVTIRDDAFTYRKKVSEDDGRISVVHEYQRTESFIAAADVAEFVTKHDRIRTNLAFYLMRGPSAGESFRVSWVMVIVLIVSAAAALWGAVRVYARYDPEPVRGGPVTGGEFARIGGWLILPGAGLLLTPIQALKVLPDIVGCFDADFVSAMGPLFSVVIGLEVAYYAVNVAAWGLLTFSFFKRRSSVPMMFIVYIVANFAFLVLDAMLAEHLRLHYPAAVDTAPAQVAVLAQAFYGAIWIPYFLRSQRVKRTFVERGPRYQPPPAEPAASAGTQAPAAGPEASSADDMELLALAKLKAGVPAADVAAWLTDRGLSPPMAKLVVDTLVSHDGGAGQRMNAGSTGAAVAGANGPGVQSGDEQPVRPARSWARVVAFGIIMLIILVVLGRLNM